jgi:hypothetical protein
MKAFTIHARPDDSPERFTFVKDGFSWPALFVPIFWILWHRLWLTLLFYVVFVLLVAWTGRLAGESAAAWVAIIGALLFAFEANNIRRLSLESRGFDEMGFASGRDLDEAELRFFDRWASGAAAPATKAAAIARAAYSPQARAHAADEPILGLFPEPER